MLAAPTEARGQQLQLKGVNRSSKIMLQLLPAGLGQLHGTPDRHDYEEGEAGLQDWCLAVDDKVAGFSEAQRAMSTFKEHVEYVARISDWAQANGLGAFARKAEPGDQVTFGPLAPVLRADGSIRVMPPQVLIALFSQMLTGDERASKGAGVLKRARERADELQSKTRKMLTHEIAPTQLIQRDVESTGPPMTMRLRSSMRAGNESSREPEAGARRSPVDGMWPRPE